MRWSAKIAYIVGLITTDGNLSKDRRHLELTSKDLDQIETFASILNLHNKIGRKRSGYFPTNYVYRIQFGSVKFYKWLISIGLTSNKTKTLNSLKVPERLFRDFLRGCLDGDGYCYYYLDRRWASSIMIYTGFTSASLEHLKWIKAYIKRLYGIDGVIRPNNTVFRLEYAKKGSLVLLNKMYYREGLPCLNRKYQKVKNALDIISREYAGVLKLVDRLP